MTPHLDKGVGTFPVDRIFEGVGRIKRASGTTSEKTFNRINAMLTHIAEEGRLDVLRTIRDKTLSFLEVWDAYRVHKDPHKLASPAELQALFPLARPKDQPTAPAEGDVAEPELGQLGRWLEVADVKPITRAGYKKALAALERRARAGATATELPQLLRDYKGECVRTKPRTFNLTRSATQAFLRDTMPGGQTHRLWVEVAGIPSLTVEQSYAKNPISVARARALRARLNAKFPGYGEMLWAMCLTGMGPNEYWGRWQTDVSEGAVRILGTKRKHRRRVVPYLEPLRGPVVLYPAFRRALLLASTGLDEQVSPKGKRQHPTVPELLKLAGEHPDAVTPYDLRRTFANWLEAAGVPRARRNIYRGHEARDMGDLYEWHEVRAFLGEDGAKMRAYIGPIDGPVLRVEKA